MKAQYFQPFTNSY